jgi:hypothetical protein
MLSSSFETGLDNEARLYGEHARLKLHAMFHMPSYMTMITSGGLESDITVDQVGNGYNYEAAEVMECLDKGLIESPSMSHEFSLELIQVLDEVSRKAQESF